MFSKHGMTGSMNNNHFGMIEILHVPRLKIFSRVFPLASSSINLSK